MKEIIDILEMEIGKIKWSVFRYLEFLYGEKLIFYEYIWFIKSSFLNSLMI